MKLITMVLGGLCLFSGICYANGDPMGDIRNELDFLNERSSEKYQFELKKNEHDLKIFLNAKPIVIIKRRKIKKPR